MDKTAPETCDLSWEPWKVPCPEDQSVHEGETPGDLIDAVNGALGTEKKSQELIWLLDLVMKKQR